MAKNIDDFSDDEMFTESKKIKELLTDKRKLLEQDVAFARKQLTDSLESKSDVDAFIKKFSSVRSAEINLQKDINSVVNKRLKFENTLIRSIELELKSKGKTDREIRDVQAASIRIIREKNELDQKINAKSKVIYANITDKITGVLGGGIVGRTAGKYFETHENKLTGAIEGSLGGGGNTMLAKLIGTFEKFPVAFTAIAGIIAAIVSRFVGLLGAALDFRSELVKSVGVSQVLADTISGPVGAAANRLREYSTDQAEVNKIAAESAGSLVTSFGDLSAVTKDNVELVSALSLRIGMSKDEAAGFVKLLERGMGLKGGLNFFKDIVSLSGKEGVSFVNVIRDIAEAGSDVAIYFDRADRSLISATINARLMGTTLASQMKAAKSFQTFEGAANNALTLQILTGAKLNPQDLFKLSNYGTPGQLQEYIMKRVTLGLKGRHLGAYQKDALAQAMGLSSYAELQTMETKRTQEASYRARAHELFKGKFTTEERERQVGAIRTLGTNTSKEDVTKHLATIDALKTSLSSAKNYTEALGLPETLKPTEQILVAILDAVDKPLKFIAEGIAKLAFGAIGKFTSFMNNPFGIVDQRTNEEMQSDMTKKHNESLDQINANPFSTYDLMHSNLPLLPKKAMGGIASRPTLAGEQGPEAVLPLTGAGVQGFTQPFMKEAIGGSGINELIDLVKQLLSKKTVIENRTYLDSRKIAEGITEISLNSA